MDERCGGNDFAVELHLRRITPDESNATLEPQFTDELLQAPLLGSFAHDLKAGFGQNAQNGWHGPNG